MWDNWTNYPTLMWDNWDTRAEREEVERIDMLLREKMEELSKDTKKD